MRDCVLGVMITLRDLADADACDWVDKNARK
jgi:hypothetical protein